MLRNRDMSKSAADAEEELAAVYYDFFKSCLDSVSKFERGMVCIS